MRMNSVCVVGVILHLPFLSVYSFGNVVPRSRVHEEKNILNTSTRAVTIRKTRSTIIPLQTATSRNEDDTAGSAATATINHVVFDFCTGCRWMPRSIWMAQELLTTFNEENLSAVSLVPSRPPPGAQFVVTFHSTVPKGDSSTTIFWDREKEGGFPEVKELKQLVRDKIDPELYLGHSDNKERDEASLDSTAGSGGDFSMPSSTDVLGKVIDQVKGPNVAIQYCTGCRWMLRSAYFATELLTTFNDEINSVTLIPSRPPEKGGIFVSFLTASFAFTLGEINLLTATFFWLDGCCWCDERG